MVEDLDELKRLYYSKTRLYDLLNEGYSGFRNSPEIEQSQLLRLFEGSLQGAVRQSGREVEKIGIQLANLLIQNVDFRQLGRYSKWDNIPEEVYIKKSKIYVDEEELREGQLSLWSLRQLVDKLVDN